MPLESKHLPARSVPSSVPPSLADSPRALLLALGTLALAWLALFAETVSWLVVVPFRGVHRMSQIGLAVFFLGLVFSFLLRRTRTAPSSPPTEPFLSSLRLAAPRPAWILCFLVLAALLRSVLPIFHRPSTLSAALFLFGGYLLLGLVLSPSRFRRWLVAALLLICTLPFGALADSYLGLALRLLTAQFVQQILSFGHIPVVSTQTVLLLERGIAHVDIPCSGLRGMWVGSWLYILLTFLDARTLGLRWLAGFAGINLGLLVANTVRVLLLVLVAHHAGRADTADAIHVPLALIGLLLCSLCGIAYLHFLVPRTAASDAPVPGVLGRRALRWLFLTALPIALCAALVSRPRPQPVQAPPPLAFATHVAAQPTELSPMEQVYFSQYGARAQKWLVTLPHPQQPQILYRASIVTVYAATADSFRAHHPPEVCLASLGLSLQSAQLLSFAPAHTARWLTLLAAPSDPVPHTAVYWFQSATRSTPDLLPRLLGQLLLPSAHVTPWLLVTVLFSPPSPTQPQLTEALLSPLLRPLYAVTGAALAQPPPLSAPVLESAHAPPP